MSWKPCLQAIVAMSTIDVEYMVVVETARKLYYMVERPLF
jgi:hypothetical protein